MKNLLVILGIIFLISCEQSDPPAITVELKDGPSERVGNKIRFSGLDWTVKVYEDQQWGPGPNYFSGHEDDITIDSDGYLHMKIVNRDGRWMSTEVISDANMGYGTYIFTVDGDLENIPENIVLGLFTWDNNTFQSAANSEVDIEISKWGDTSDKWTLQYGVQPINFGTFFPERAYRPEYDLGKLIGVTTHAFTWTEDKISWVSYAGEKYGEGEKLAEWEFTKDNPPRAKQEGGKTSDAIVIPAPGATTNARINFWITPWVSPVPTDGKEQEIVIRRFEYRPL